jgi:hypothetical protein
MQFGLIRRLSGIFRFSFKLNLPEIPKELTDDQPDTISLSIFHPGIALLIIVL